jgi:hypothetical protein
MTHFAEVTVAQWRGDVKRWHAHQNPKLRDAGDTIHMHSLRCCLLLMRLNPDFTKDMLAACIMHDAAETITGDIPYGAKQGGRLAQSLAWAESIANTELETPLADRKSREWIKLVDRIDPYLIALQHAPKELECDEWAWAFNDIYNAAKSLGVLGAVQEIIAEATEKMT